MDTANSVKVSQNELLLFFPLNDIAFNTLKTAVVNVVSNLWDDVKEERELRNTITRLMLSKKKPVSMVMDKEHFMGIMKAFFDYEKAVSI